MAIGDGFEMDDFVYSDAVHNFYDFYTSWGTPENTTDLMMIGSPLRKWDSIWAKEPVIQTSDSKEKRLVKDCDLGLSFVLSLRPVSYQWRVEKQANPVRHYGFLGDEVLDVLKGRSFGGVVQTQGGIGMSYTELISPLVKAIQEQQEQIETLKSEIRALRRKR